MKATNELIIVAAISISMIILSVGFLVKSIDVNVNVKLDDSDKMFIKENFNEVKDDLLNGTYKLDIVDRTCNKSVEEEWN